ncbi:hypothetical protein HDV00_004898 [Rhizophlyctis rosea]|nr:hypothetical protein HDV00_004898 [Rhizophlyctis rosea]
MTFLIPSNLSPRTRTTLLFAAGGATVPILLGIYFSQELTTPETLSPPPSAKTRYRKLKSWIATLDVGTKMFIIPCAVAPGIVALLLHKPLSRYVAKAVAWAAAQVAQLKVPAAERISSAVVHAASAVPGTIVEVTTKTIPGVVGHLPEVVGETVAHLPEAVSETVSSLPSAIPTSIPVPTPTPLPLRLFNLSNFITGSLIASLSFPLSTALIGFQAAISTPALLDGKEVPKPLSVSLPEACDAAVRGLSLGWQLPGSVWRWVRAGVVVWGGAVGVAAGRFYIVR